MAKQHKAPTSVTIASTAEESALHEFVQRHWKTGALFFVAIAAGILIRVYWNARSKEVADQSWGQLAQVVTFHPLLGVQASSPEAIAEVAETLRGESAAPWAKGLEAGARIREDDFQGAREALDALESGWPDHVLAAEPWPDGHGGAEPLPVLAKDRMTALEAWEAGRTSLHANPPLPEDAPRVRLRTSVGNIVLGLDPERAPRHAENFLKLCREGFYDGTRFHRVVPETLIQGGDPNSRDADQPALWGQGGPGYTVPAEINERKHFAYVLAAAKKAQDLYSSGSQFYITDTETHQFDGQYTVYGAVLEGQDVVDQIASSEVEGERPVDPVVIEGTDVL